MTDADSLVAVVGILNEIKELIKPQNPLLPVYTAFAGAIFGVLGTAFAKEFHEHLARKRSIKVVASQIRAEIKAILDIVEIREYIDFMRAEIEKLPAMPNQRSILQVHISEDVMPIYRANLNNLYLLDQDIQVKVVKFYRYLSALIEDIKPEGTFNDERFGLTPKGGEQFMKIATEAILTGQDIIKKIESVHLAK